MANSQVKDLSEQTSPAADDVLYLQSDPGGTPSDKKIKVKTFSRLGYSSKSAGYTAVEADRGSIIEFTTAGVTLALTAAATLGAGWHCIIVHSGLDTDALTIDPNSSETIDGMSTLTMYAGEVRRLRCDGSNFTTVMEKGGRARFTSSGSFILPSKVTALKVHAWGGGGGGGGANGGSAGANRGGGGGGGGGAHVMGDVLPADIGSPGTSVSVTVAAQTTAANGGSAGNGTAGSQGGTSSFGSLLYAYGGGPGAQGTTSGGDGGGGGGGASSTTSRTQGYPLNSGTGVLSSSGTAGGPGGQAGTADAGSAEFGGGGGGRGTTSGGGPGGKSLYGGGGGAGGAGLTTGNAEAAGGTGGQSNSSTAWAALNGGGSAGGAVNGNTGTPGADAASHLQSGGGGGGGGSQDSGTGGAGADGGAPAGGGGGGGGGTTVGGAGGKGARGEVLVIYS